MTHIPPHENRNRPIVDVEDARVPLNYFNIVRLRQGQAFEYAVPGYETCIVPAIGTIDVEVEGVSFAEIGRRQLDVWSDEPEGVYVPTGAKAIIVCRSDSAEIFVAGARYDKVLAPFDVRAGDIHVIQYGSDETKTHRKIKHILGAKYHDRVGRLLVSELYTVGQGGWSGFPPHKHDTERPPIETRHDETYNFRFRPSAGFGMLLLRPDDQTVGDAYHLVEGSTILLDKGYHPCVVAPGYEMYYFTILSGLSQRPLVQYFDPVQSYQIETIPGIKDMIANFR